MSSHLIFLNKPQFRYGSTVGKCPISSQTIKYTLQVQVHIQRSSRTNFRSTLTSNSIPTWHLDPQHPDSWRDQIYSPVKSGPFSTPNKCYYIVFEPDNVEDINLINSAIKVLTEKLRYWPKLVISISENQTRTDPAIPGNITCPWVSLINYHKVRITCPCGEPKTGEWKSPGFAAFSPNLKKPICCNAIMGKTLRITYNNDDGFIMVEDNKMDPNIYEGAALQLFIDKYHLNPTFLWAEDIWGSINEETGLWEGIVGNVGDFYSTQKPYSYEFSKLVLPLTYF